jgi:hypothetical protein
MEKEQNKCEQKPFNHTNLNSDSVITIPYPNNFGYEKVIKPVSLPIN